MCRPNQASHPASTIKEGEQHQDCKCRPAFGLIAASLLHCRLPMHLQRMQKTMLWRYPESCGQPRITQQRGTARTAANQLAVHTYGFIRLYSVCCQGTICNSGFNTVAMLNTASGKGELCRLLSPADSAYEGLKHPLDGLAIWPAWRCSAVLTGPH